MFQSLTIVGNLGQKPELKRTSSGVPVCSFSVATTRKWQDADGNEKEKTVWFKVSVWRGQAEPCYKYLDKGSKVLVIGELEEAHAFARADGTTGASLEVTAKEVKFLSASGTTEATAPTAPASATALPAAQAHNSDW